MSKVAPQNKHQEFLQNSDQLLGQLLRAARAGDKNDAVVIDAATRAKAKTALNSDKKALNSMASIIGRGGSGAVGAVCHDGGKFLLSTNRPDDEGKVRKLFTLIKEKDQDQLRQEVYSHAVLNVEKHFSEPLFSNHLSELKAIRGGDIKLPKNLIKQVANYSKIQNSQQKIKALEELSLLANKVLTTYEDKLLEKVGLRNFLTDLRTPAKHIERITGYKSQNAKLFVHAPEFVARENTHAEMNILNELFMQGKLLGEQQFFIGDTKKCCASCHIVVTSVNQKTSPNKIEMSGTHGMAYIPWQKPEFLRLNEQELKDALAVRGHQPDQINVLVKLAADINSTFEANMKDLIAEVQTRSSQPLSERQARSVSPLARTEDIIPTQLLAQSQKITEMTQEEREQEFLVHEKQRKAQKLNGELRILQNSFNLPDEEKKLSRLKETLNTIQSKQEVLSQRLTTTQSNIDKCIKTQEELEKEQETKQELYKRYELQLQKTKEIWADSAEGEVKNAAIREISRAEELLTKAKENLEAVENTAKSTLDKLKKFEQVLQQDNQRKDELLIEKTEIEKKIADLNTEIKNTQEKLKNKTEELDKAKAEWEAAEKKLTQIRVAGQAEESVALPPKNPKKSRIELSEKEESLIKKAKTDEVEPKLKDISSSIKSSKPQAAISPGIDAKKREEVKQKQTFTPIEYPGQNVKSPKKRVLGRNLDNEESLHINKKQKMTEGQPLKEDQLPPQKSIVTSKKQAADIGKKIEPFIYELVKPPVQPTDKEKKKTPLSSLSKGGKGRFGSRGKY